MVRQGYPTNHYASHATLERHETDMEQTTITGTPQNHFAVLFVDDEAMALETFDMACRSYFPVYTASSAQEAVDILQRHGKEIAICISDQRMPQINGLDLLKETRQQHPHIVRILTTAYSDYDHMVAALNEAEIFRYIPKPWDITKLRQELAEAMARFFQRRREQRRLQERRNAMFKVSGQLAVELRNISLGIQDMRRSLPPLLETYDKAIAAGIDHLPLLKPRQRDGLSSVLDNMENRVSQAKTLMELIFSQTNADKIDATRFSEISMVSCVQTALASFPFTEEQRQKLHVVIDEDFCFYGSTLLMVKLLFNLLRNALMAVQIAGKGDIHIRLKAGDICNCLYVRNSGTGIMPEGLPYMLEAFYSTHGAEQNSDVGFDFCRMAAEAMGGMIDCQSDEGMFTEFVVTLPSINGANNAARH